MTDIMQPVYMWTGIAMMMILLSLIDGTGTAWIWVFVGLAPWVILGALMLADRLGLLPKPKSPEDWLYENFLERWVEFYCPFAQFWERIEGKK